MILHRLGRAVRQQDWFTVVLEVVIVVLGIFIALQVDEWNENRKLRQQETAYLAALADDLQVMLTDIDRLMAGRAQRRDAMLRGLAALEACDDSPAARDAVGVGLDQYQLSRSIVYVGATYEEMVAVGALARLEDPDLKRLIAATFSTLEGEREFIRTVRVSLPVIDDIFWSHVDYSVDEAGRYRAKVDIPALCGIREVRNAFVEIIDIQGDSYSYLEDARGRVVTLLERLGADA